MKESPDALESEQPMTTETPAAPELEFPLEWHGKIIAHDRADVPAEIGRVLRQFGVEQAATRGNISSGGKYVTYNVSVIFVDRAMMTRVTESLAAIPGVRMVI